MIRIPAVMVVWCSLALLAPAAAGTLVETGETGGKPFAVLRDPAATPGRSLLVLLPGWRPPDASRAADLGDAELTHGALLADGWLVATTSYGRNGPSVAAGADDVADVVAHLVRRYGARQTVIVAGVSLGGAIAVELAEREAVLRRDPGVRRAFAFAGAVAMGLPTPDESTDRARSCEPGVPLLLVSNRDELASATAYAECASGAEAPPARWFVERDGHVELSRAERRAAVAAVFDWVATGRVPEGVREPHDATIDTPSRPPRGHPLSGGVGGVVTKVDAAFGNLELDLSPADLASIGLVRGDRCTVRCGPTTAEAVLGVKYSDAPPGGLVVLPTADGGLRLAENLGDASRRLAAAEGDTIVISPVAESAKGESR